ncbi:SET domain-containing protein [Lophiostoma macrostomum CBS 122681]|uniref:SET domain-containing protein n=1 Tax=Lophiostoma macrostomum CBS 122681 TaxID=1314788 RepID=A0A6A6SKU4_9PLEO|nr:SET domain-containing protein [Lophiostoma macrostomum CBS 122681]
MTDTSTAPFYATRSPSCIATDGKPGRGAFSGADYGAGELIISKRRPTIASLDTERLQDTCANCYTWTEGSSIGSRLYVKEGVSVQACGGCKRFRYCSKTCQKEAWYRGHKYECKALKQVIDKPMPKAVLATMELLIRRKHGLVTDAEWAAFGLAESHIDDFKQTGQYSGIELMAMGVSQFSWTQDVFSKDLVAAMYAKVLTNSLTLITPTLDPLGIVFDASLSVINHSCDPNACIMMDGPEISLRTLKPIKKDEEIFISYIDTTNPYPRRQSELKSRWFFTCRCSKCLKGPVLLEDQWISQPNEIDGKWKDLADKFIGTEEWATDPANYVGDEPDQKRIAAIQGHAFAQYEEEQGTPEPAEAIKVIKDAMRMCYQSKLWPVYRQPYAALRDDLIVNMLAVGDYQGAWQQCAKRYWHILPKLHPRAFHPVRVVQVWQSAMLAYYLQAEGGMAGADVAPIALLLVMEVMNAAPLSHGKDSTFARSVEKKFGEMVLDMQAGAGGDIHQELSERMPQTREQFKEMATWSEY